MEQGLLNARPAHLGRPPALFPRWRPGVPVAGKRLLVWPEQGFGDAIMALRYVKLAADAGADVVLMAAVEVAPLFAGQVPAEVISRGRAYTMPWADLACTDFEIMRGHMATNSPVPPQPLLAGTPYRKGGIGIATRGDPTHPNDANRSLPTRCGEILLSVPGTISLLPEDTGATNFQETADLIAGLDHVVSVDTSIAHLAASMGKPTTLLLPACNLDWRWETEGARTRWYPSVEIVRQDHDGWERVVETLASRLAPEEHN